MSESPALPLLFTQLQARYPTSGLLTELVQMNADRYVVRALVQLGSMTLATSMATATTVEQAEDQARLRVLALLGIHATPFRLSDISVPDISVPDISVPDISVPDVAFSGHSTPPQPRQTTFQDTTPTIATVSPIEAIAPLLPFPTPAFEPSVTIAPTPVALAEPDAIALAPMELEPETFDDPPDLDDVSYNKATYDEEPFEAYEPLVKPIIEDVSDDRAATKIAAAPVAKSKPRKSGADTPSASAIDTANSAASSSAPSGSASRDLSSLISQIGVEIDRIGWSKRQGSTYLQKTYGKKTRSELTDDELEDFLTYLNTQPSAGEE